MILTYQRLFLLTSAENYFFAIYIFNKMEPEPTEPLNFDLGTPYDNFLGTLAKSSQPIYRKRVQEFFEFCAAKGVDRNEPYNLLEYLTFLKNDEDFEYSGSTLWTISSMISSWFLATNGINTKVAVPMLFRQLKQWKKQDETKKASTFTKEDLNKFLREYGNGNGGLTMKVAVIIAIYGLLRCCEIIQVKFSDLQFYPDHVRIKVYRAKQAGEKKLFQYMVTDDNSRSLLSLYVNSFPEKVS